MMKTIRERMGEKRTVKAFAANDIRKTTGDHHGFNAFFRNSKWGQEALQMLRNKRLSTDMNYVGNLLYRAEFTFDVASKYLVLRAAAEAAWKAPFLFPEAKEQFICSHTGGLKTLQTFGFYNFDTRPRRAENDHAIRIGRRADAIAEAYGYKPRWLSLEMYESMLKLCQSKLLSFTLECGTYHILTNFSMNIDKRTINRTRFGHSRGREVANRWLIVLRDNVKIMEVKGYEFFQRDRNGMLGDWKKRYLWEALRVEGKHTYESYQQFELAYKAALNMAKALREVSR
jgi:hypothetical protein